MIFLRIYKVFFLFLFLISFSSYGIYNLNTKKELDQSKVSDKNWLFLDQNCHHCDVVLLELQTFCKGKKPLTKAIGFFVVGFNQEAILKKLKPFHKNYEIYLGSSSEFYNMYNVKGTPSLLLKGQKKIIQGKKNIMKNIRKTSSFCML